MILYYITDRTQFAGTEAERRSALLRCVAEAAAADIDFIQLREKDLSAAELERLGKDVLRTILDRSEVTRLLINSRSDIALAIGADGVHLTSSDLEASEARAVWASSVREQSCPGEFLVATSCHSVDDVRRAESHGADFVVLGPIFEKAGTSVQPLGVDGIRSATPAQVPDTRVEAGDNRGGIPVLALGGVNLANARLCIEAGAAGVAGIRLFQEGDLREKLSILRETTLGFGPRTPSSAQPAKKYDLRYRRRLPHIESRDRAVFLTFKTGGSLDLSDKQREIVLRCCLHDNQKRYRLYAAVVMSNHVHLLLRPLRDARGEPFTIREILQSLKSSSAHLINRQTAHSGPVWREESFDRLIRDHADFQEKLLYIEMNPVKAGLALRAGEYKWSWVAQQ